LIDDLKYVRDLKAFTRAAPTIADLPRVESEMYGGNDRARVLMLGSMVESCLEFFLKYRTRPSLNSDDNRQLFDYRGPLGDFSSKIIIGYSFNWYGPETRHDLDLTRILRNEFAHSRQSFCLTDPAVAAVCTNLKAPTRWGQFVPSAWIRSAALDERDAATDVNHPRTRFIITCHVLAEGLLVNSGQVYEGSAAIDLF
jgi:hypothetical protein